MERPEIGKALSKLEILEGRVFTPQQVDVWLEILGEHNHQDAVAAVLAYHSKPFKRPAYPGDIKALILETEAVRLRRCGTIEINEEEWFNGPTGPIHKRLRHLVATGQWTPDDYRSYRRSGLTLDQYLEKQEERVG